MAKAYQFGLWPQSAATLDVLLCMQIKSCLPFSNSNPQSKPTGIIMPAGRIASRNPMKNWETIADNFSNALGVGAVSQQWTRRARTIFVVDAHRALRHFTSSISP